MLLVGVSFMQPFSLAATPEIVFGAGKLAALPDKVLALTGEPSTVMLIADPALRPLGITDRAIRLLEAGGHDVHVFDRFSGEPKASDIDTASKIARAANTRCVVGMGGGSSLDTAKVAAVCIVSGRPAEAYEMCKEPLPPVPLPVIALPTTAGTGSEVTRTSVFSNSAKMKMWAWGKELQPRIALLDPELSLAVPPQVTAGTGLDALVHAIEAATNRNRNEAADLYCHRAIALISSNLQRAILDGGDIEARAALLLGSCYAGIGIDNCGTALAHNISHALAGLAPVAHGRATGLAMLATMEWVAEGASELFSRVAAAMGEPAHASSAVKAFERLVRNCGIKVSFENEGFELDRPEQLARQMAAPENAPMLRSTLRAISEDDLLMLARKVYALR